MPEAETKEPTPKAWIRLGHTKCCEIVGFEAIGTEHTCFGYVAGGLVADWILKRVNSTPALVAAAEAAEKFISARLLLTADDARKVLDQLTAALSAAKGE